MAASGANCSCGDWGQGGLAAAVGAVELPAAYWEPAIHFTAWIGPFVAVLYASILARLRRRRPAPISSGKPAGRFQTRLRQLLRIERPGDGLLAMEEMGPARSGLGSMLVISLVLIPWLLFLVSFLLGLVMSGMESWGVDDGVRYLQYGMSLLISPIALVRPVTVGGKLACLAVMLFTYVLMSTVLSVASVLRIIQRAGGHMPRSMGALIFIVFCVVPLLLCLLGLLLTVILMLAEGQTFPDAYMGTLDILTTGGQFGMGAGQSYSWPTGVFLIQLLLIVTLAVAGAVIGLLGSHPTFLSFMRFLEGCDELAEEDVAGTVSRTSRASLGSSGVLTPRTVAGATSLESLVHQHSSKDKLDEQARCELADVQVSTFQASIQQCQDKSRGGWTSPFQDDAQLSELAAQSAQEPPAPLTPPLALLGPQEDTAKEKAKKRVQWEVEPEVAPESEKELVRPEAFKDPEQDLRESLEAAELRAQQAEARAASLEQQHQADIERAASCEQQHQADVAELRLKVQTLEAERLSLETAHAELLGSRASVESTHRVPEVALAPQEPDTPGSQSPREAAKASGKAEPAAPGCGTPKTRGRAGSLSQPRPDDDEVPDPDQDPGPPARQAEAETTDAVEGHMDTSVALAVAEAQVRSLTCKLMDAEDHAARAEGSAQEWARRAHQLEQQLKALRQGSRESCWGNQTVGDLTSRIAEPLSARLGEGPLSARLFTNFSVRSCV